MSQFRSASKTRSCVWEPRSVTTESSRKSLIRACSFSRNGPSPMMSHVKSSCFARNSAHASIRFSNPLKETSRPTLKIRDGPGETGSGCRRRKNCRIHSVVNAMNLRRRFRAALLDQSTAVVGLDRDKFRRVANFAEQIVLREVGHEILAMRGDAEWNAAQRFEKDRRVRGAIGEMNVNVLDAFAPK